MAEQQPTTTTITAASAAMTEEKPRKEGCSAFCKRLFRCKRKKNDKEGNLEQQPALDQAATAQKEPIAATTETTPVLDTPVQLNETPNDEQAAEPNNIAPIGQTTTENAANLLEGDNGASAGEVVGERSSKIIPVDEEQRPLSIFIQRGIEDAQRDDEEGEETDSDQEGELYPSVPEVPNQAATLPKDGEPSFAETATMLADSEHPLSQPEATTTGEESNQLEMISGIGGDSNQSSTMGGIEEAHKPETTSDIGESNQLGMMSTGIGGDDSSQPTAMTDIGDSSQPTAMTDIGDSSQPTAMTDIGDSSQPEMMSAFGTEDSNQPTTMNDTSNPNQQTIMGDTGDSSQPTTMGNIGDFGQSTTMTDGVGEAMHQEMASGIEESSKPEMSILQPNLADESMESQGFTHPTAEMADEPTTTETPYAAGMEGLSGSMPSAAEAEGTTEETKPVYSEAMQGVMDKEEAAPGIPATNIGEISTDFGTGDNVTGMPAEENTPIIETLGDSQLAYMAATETAPVDASHEVTPMTDALEEGPPADMQELTPEDDGGEAADGVPEMAQSDPLVIEEKPKDKKRKSFLQQMFAKKK